MKIKHLLDKIVSYISARTNYTIRMISHGILSYIPRFKHFGMKARVSLHQTLPARYYYSLWLRHLILAHKNGLTTELDCVAELGPGQSLGAGLAALLTGANCYYALDTVKHSYNNHQLNLKIFYELIDLLEKRAKIPDASEFPMVEPYLESYEFPSSILTNERLGKTLQKDRLESIKCALSNLGKSRDERIEISYIVPWHDSQIIKNESVDLILSQAVLEHVDNLSATYNAIYQWLKPSGFMSHSIDFRSHGLAKKWNGHWTYSPFVWWLIRGKRPFLLNRETHSKHKELIKRSGFKVVCDLKMKQNSAVKRNDLASRFKAISDEDLITRSTFIQAVKNKNA